MNKYYRSIFLGLLLIFFDLYIFPIDILPNIIGYIIIAITLGTLALREATFEGGKIIAWILVAMEFLDIYLRWSGQSLTAVNSMVNKVYLFSQGLTILNFLLIYFICKGTRNLTSVLCNNKQKKRIKFISRLSWQLYGVATIATLILNYFNKIGYFNDKLEKFNKGKMILIGLAIICILTYVFIVARSLKPEKKDKSL